MTIPVGSAITTHLGNGTADTFDYEFKITSASDLLVTVTDTNDVDAVLILDVDYNVLGVGDNNGGAIILIAGALILYYGLTIEDNIEVSQLVPFGNQSSFSAQLHEDAFDKNTRLAGIAFKILENTLKLPSTLQSASTILPKPESNASLVWNETANSIINGPAVSDIIAYSQLAISAAETAQESAASILNALTVFGDLYLGSFAVGPILNNEGGALVDGNSYWNTFSVEMFFYDESGAAWVSFSSAAIASQVLYNPSGGMSALNVEDAINELDSEKTSTSDVNSIVAAALSAAAVQDIGILKPMLGTALPANHLYPDGLELVRTDYPDLYNYALASANMISQTLKDADPINLGGNWGDGNGATTFTKPMLGGMHIRIDDMGRGVNPTQGVGGYKEDEVKAHTHMYGKDISTHFDTDYIRQWFTHGVEFETSSTGGPENTVKNIVYSHCFRALI